MITLPTELEKFMQGQDLTGLKPFALLYRNKWNSVTEKYELDTTPIDISAHITKPNTLSMTLDVNEVAQYNANNVTLSLSDTKNQFVEGTPNSYFPAGYQIYGSKVVLYYGIEKQDYLIENGKLIWADPKLYLVNNGRAYINTGVPSDAVTNYKIDYRITDSSIRIFATGADVSFRNKSDTFIGIANSGLYWYYGTGNSAYHVLLSKSSEYYLQKNRLEVNYSSTSATASIYNNIEQISSYTTTASELSNNNYYLFGLNRNGTATLDGSLRIYSAQYYGSNINKHLVPVPQGLRIGSFTVPSNGMFDIVNQQFYGNSGAGSFTIGKDGNNEKYSRTPLFTGVIKEPPTHKPEKYQVDVKLVSPLEMLKDIEAKDFSDKVTGETLTYKSTDSDGHRIYWTTGTGVGGFDAVYANGVKLFEGVDYETEQLNELVKPAIVTIINSAHYSATITADYYTWKRDLTVEQIVAGLVGLAGYDSATEDIRKVVWNTSVRNQPIDTGFFAGIGYYESDEHEYSFNWRPTRNSSWSFTTSGSCKNTLPTNWDYSFVSQVNVEGTGQGVTIISLGDNYNSNTFNVTFPWNGSQITKTAGVVGVTNGISVRVLKYVERDSGLAPIIRTSRMLFIHKITNGSASLLYSAEISSTSTTINSGQIKITRRGNTVTVYKDGTQIASTTISTSMDYHFQGEYRVGHTADVKDFWAYNQSWNIYDNNLRLYAGNITRPCFISDICDMTAAGDAWGEISATLTGSASYFLNAYFSPDLITWTGPDSYNLNTVIARGERYMYYVLGVQSNPSAGFKITDPTTYYLATTILLQLVNLSGLTVLEALQDFALISGYEFGVDRQGVFFFRPRISSTTPVYELDHSQLEKVDTVKKNLSDFFTKLTLTFAQVPLEFYANDGPRPNSIDKYGVINKEIDKPDIVNYDNPELAQAIGPQLLEVYSALPNVIQAVGKLNLALELGDTVNLKRNFNLIADPEGSDFNKYRRQQTYYRACKITGMNYNFAKRQITYTLRDVSNSNNIPQIEAYGFAYDLPIQLGKLKTE